MNRNKIIILIAAVLLSVQLKSQSNDSIVTEGKIRIFSFQNIEYAVLKISYKNSGIDTIYFWVQNWKLHYLDNDDVGIFKNCPYQLNGSILNAITFFTDISALKSIWLSTDRYPDDTLANCSFIKKIPPDETFYSNIIIADSTLLSYLKTHKPKDILIHYSYIYDSKLFSGLNNNIFYNDNELFIYYKNNPDLVSCSPANVTSDKGILNKTDYINIPKHRFRINRIGITLDW